MVVDLEGTEYYDGKQKRYVDYPITDVLQMIGRAGRPQFDEKGIAVVLVHDLKKHFYKRFLYEPFPVESRSLSPSLLLSFSTFSFFNLLHSYISSVLYFICL